MLLYLALQIANTKQARLTNWGVLAERYMSVYSQTSNFELADVIIGGEIISILLMTLKNWPSGHYMENICIANEGALVMANSFTRRDEGMVQYLTDTCVGIWIAKVLVIGLRNFLQRGFSEDLNQAISQAIQSNKSLP